MDIEELDRWFSREQRDKLGTILMKRVGITRTRTECFLRLWVYLLVKQKRESDARIKPPLTKLELLIKEVSCTHREAAELFYCDRERGSDRAAGMMLDKLAALRLIKKSFDGNTSNIEIQPISEILEASYIEVPIQLQIDLFNPRCDAILVATLLSTNYHWLNRSSENVQTIAKRLRFWASQYPNGMRVLRRTDNLNPVGFYCLYPVRDTSEKNFSIPSTKVFTLASKDPDFEPFEMAAPGDKNCLSIFIRSWTIDSAFLQNYRVAFIEDTQQVLQQMLKDFPNLCDIYTLMIHPSYEELAQALGFHKTIGDTQSIYWMYLAVDRFLALNVKAILDSKRNS
jgi:hypothetical protein